MRRVVVVLLCCAHFCTPTCVPLHSRLSGVSLFCCNRRNRLSDNCEFNRPHHCHRNQCRCYVQVDGGDLNCSDPIVSASSTSYDIWRDHGQSDLSAFPCRSPRFPNPGALFYLILNQVTNDELRDVAIGLSEYKVISLQWNLVGDGDLYDIDDFVRYFRFLRHLDLQIVPPSLLFGGDRSTTILPRGLMQLRHLQVLTMTNLNGNLFDENEAANFKESIKRLQIANCPLFDALPTWLTNANQMEQIRVHKTALTEIKLLLKLVSLRFLYLSQNNIKYLYEAFECPFVEDIDLSKNKIENIDGLSTSNLSNLKFLDLSHNPLRVLPDRVFAKLPSLIWLRLEQTHIQRISADHLLGLSNLKHLWLESNANLMLEPFSLLPLVSLETLNLRRCNLTAIPDATTQACQLQQLWISFNLLHSKAALCPETLIQLSRLRQLVFSENPLVINPEGLFLLPKENKALLDSVINSLKQLPVWWKDPSVSHFWWQHLVLDQTLSNSSRYFYTNLFPKAMQKTTSYNIEYLRSYSAMMTRLAPYQLLLMNSRCETVRRLRSLDVESARELVTTSRPLSNGPLDIQPAVDVCQNMKRILACSLLLNVSTVVFAFLYCLLHLARKHLF